MRFTPAHAGTTALAGFGGGLNSVHPRARGDNRPIWRVDQRQRGSPPRTRGQHQAVIVEAADKRFTPAHAGTTRKSARSCLRRSGSPPRTRGQPHRAPQAHSVSRFTPAHAGTTLDDRAAGMPAEVHPRARGDNGRWWTPDRAVLGSPPRTRGQLPPIVAVDGIIRFTPAHAGTTSAVFRRQPALTVHPRARGDNAAVLVVLAVLVGSPPRTRGQQRGDADVLLKRRFTPAHAGTTRRPARAALRQTVHPRARGDNSNGSHKSTPRRGSPPRTRGQRVASSQHICACRFTPAHAGTTRAWTPPRRM